MKWLEWLKREGKALLVLTLYFLFCYGIMVIIKKLILLHYEITYFGFGAAALGAFISAKAVLVVEYSPLARVMRKSVPVLKVIFDGFIYTVLAFVFLYLEKTLEMVHKEGTFRMAFLTVGNDEDSSLFLASVIWAGLAFLGYAFFSAISRHLGPGELFKIFFTPPGEKAERSQEPVEDGAEQKP